MPTPEGYNHIALFSPADSSTPRFLTKGDWEVTGGIAGVNAKKGLVLVYILLPESNFYLLAISYAQVLLGRDAIN